jgi:peptide/nickel transport system ATP-binding protein
MSDSTHSAPATKAKGAPCLEVRNLKMHFGHTGGFFKQKTGTVKAVDGVDLTVHDGETVGLVGESGCGKSTLGRTILRVYEPTEGEIRYRRRGTSEWVDLTAARPETLAGLRLDIRMIFQDPFTSLNARQTVLEAIGQPLFGQGVARSEVRDRVAAIMQKVGLRAEYMSRYPHAFSGGERQRIVIARALVVEPHLVVADEAVSALDVSVRAQTLNLLQDLQDEFDLTYLFISHDLSVVKHISDHVAVMYVGRIVEFAPTNEIFARPRHPYTAALIDAIPVVRPELRGRTRRELTGEVPDPSRPPPGCLFHPRCPFATDRCRKEVPELRPMSGGGQAACHHAEEIELQGLPS